MADEKKTFLIEIETDADDAAVEKLNDAIKGTGAEIKNLQDIRGNASGTPYDATIAAAERIKQRAAEAAQAVTTSVAQINAVQAQTAASSPQTFNTPSGPSDAFKTELANAEKRVKALQQERDRAAERARLSQPGVLGNDKAGADDGGGGLGDVAAAAGVGGIGAGVVIAAKAIRDMIETTHAASEELRKFARDGVQATLDLAAGIETNAEGTLDKAGASVRKLSSELEDLRGKSVWGQDLESLQKDLVLQFQIVAAREIEARAVQQMVAQEEQALQVLRLRAAGQKDLADAAQRQAEVTKELAAINANPNTTFAEKIGFIVALAEKAGLAEQAAQLAIGARYEKQSQQQEAAGRQSAAQGQITALLGAQLDAQADTLKRNAELQERINGILQQQTGPMERLAQLNNAIAQAAGEQANADATRAAEEERRAQAAEKTGRHLAVEAQVTALIGQHRTRDAEDLQRAAALQEKINGILQAQVGPMERLALLNAAIAQGAGESANITAKRKEADAAALANMQGQVHVAELLADRRTREAAAAERQLKLDQEIRAIRNDAQKPPEDRAALEAGARRKAALEEQEITRKQRESDAEAVAEARAGVAAQGATNAGLQQEASLLGINEALRKQLKAIKDSDSDPQTKQRLSELATEEAVLKRIKALRAGLHQTPQQRDAKRAQQKQDRQDDRINEQSAVNKARNERANDAHLPPSKRVLTPDEEKAIREEFRGKPLPKTESEKREDFFNKSSKKPPGVQPKGGPKGEDFGHPVDPAQPAPGIGNGNAPAAPAGPAALGVGGGGMDAAAGSADKAAAAAAAAGAKIAAAFDKVSASMDSAGSAVDGCTSAISGLDPRICALEAAVEKLQNG